MHRAAVIIAVVLSAARPGAQAPSSPPQRLAFEVASIKPSPPDAQGMMISGPAPSQFTTRNVPLRTLIVYAYARRADQIAGGPGWIDSERFDIVAKYPSAEAQRQVPAMLRVLLEDRFRLKTHLETREGLVYHLVTARADKRLGPNLRKTDVDCVAIRKQERIVTVDSPCLAVQVGEGRDRVMWAGGRTMAQLATMLASAAGRDVIDQTSLAGEFDARLRWRPDAGITPTDRAPADLDAGASLFTALQEQLGLKLESAQGPVEQIVIDSVEHPTPD